MQGVPGPNPRLRELDPHMPPKKKKKKKIFMLKLRPGAVRYKTKTNKQKQQVRLGPCCCNGTKPGLSPHFLPPQTPDDVPSLEGTQESLSGDVGLNVSSLTAVCPTCLKTL